MPSLPGPGSPALSPSQLSTLAALGQERNADVGDVLFRVGDRTLSVHRDPRGRGGDTGSGRPRDRPSRRFEVPGRAEPPVRPGGLPHGGRHRAAALHRGRPRLAAVAAVRGRAAQRPPAVGVHRPARGTATGAGRGCGDHRPALLAGDDADARLRAQPAPAVHMARRAGRERSPGAAAERHRAARPLDRRGLPGARDRPGPRARARRSTCSSSAPDRPAWAPPSTALPKDSTRWSSTAPCLVARPARRDGSRTTSGSRRGSAERS